MKKHALITGSSGLIGSEMVREFLQAGYTVTGFDLKENKELDHPDFQFVKADLSKEADIKKAFAKIKNLDVLINNAARANPHQKKIHELSLKDWEEGMAINLTSVFLMTKYSIPLLKKSKGNIINISSTRHLMSEANTEIYSASKGAMDALTRALAISLSHEVRVNSISPGWIDDPKGKFSKKDHEQHPAGRVGRPSDIAQSALFLARDGSSFITGQDFVVDGGMSVKMIYR